MLAFLSLVEQQLGHQGQLNPLLLAPLLPSMRKLLALSRNGPKWHHLLGSTLGSTIVNPVSSDKVTGSTASSESAPVHYIWKRSERLWFGKYKIHLRGDPSFGYDNGAMTTGLPVAMNTFC